MRKEEDKFELPIEKADLEDYFYDINYDHKTGDTKKGMKEAPKQFKAAVKIVDYLLSNKDRSFSKAVLIQNTSDIKSDFDDEAVYEELTPDAYKHAITFLSKALIITNVHNGETTIDWGFNPNIEIHVPKTAQDRYSKSHMIVGTLFPEISYENFERAKRIFKSNIYDFMRASFFDYTLKENEDTPICDPEKIPYWKEEIELVKQGGYSSQEEFNEIMYQKTGDERYLPQTAKDIFVF